MVMRTRIMYTNYVTKVEMLIMTKNSCTQIRTQRLECKSPQIIQDKDICYKSSNAIRVNQDKFMHEKDVCYKSRTVRRVNQDKIMHERYMLQKLNCYKSWWRQNHIGYIYVTKVELFKQSIKTKSCRKKMYITKVEQWNKIM